MSYLTLPLVTIVTTLLVVSCTISGYGQSADAIYSGGNIITLEESQPSAEAVAVKDGKIIAIGSHDALMAYKNTHTKWVNLGGNTLLPGFIDAHGHITQVGLLAQSANIAAPPDGNSVDFASLIKNMKAHIGSRQTQEMGWLLGMNYDDSQLAEKQHPTAKDLDQISTELPVMIIHQSGHLAVINSKAMQLLDIDSSTPDPAGGHLRRVSGTNKPNGVLEETAFFAPVLKIIAPKSQQTIFDMITVAQQAYTAAGFTTAQEGRATPSMIHGLRLAAKKALLSIDVVAFPGPDLFADDEVFTSVMATADAAYSNGYRIGGFKLSLDGSPQGKTAWLSQSYHVAPDGKASDYAGYPAMTMSDLDKYIDMAYRNSWQVLVHSNGDAASDQFIRAIGKAQNQHKSVDIRPVIIHAQVIREDQLDAMKQLNVIPSFMSVHTFYWGDWHRDSVLGEQRARRISPARSSLNRAMLYTSHNDAPVTLPNAMMILSSQVNRTTRSGLVLGKEQRVSVMDALKSITINAAYQYSEEHSKGSIAVGKLADFVILDRNPLTVDPTSLKSIKIVETIKAGKSVFSAN